MPTVPTVPTPDWFEDREQLPLCGYEIHVVHADVARRECFAGAVADGRPAEYVIGSTGDEGDRASRWFRSLGGGRVEVLEWQGPSTSSSPAARPGRWVAHTCTSIVFRDDPGDELDHLPTLDDCQQRASPPASSG